MLACRTNAEVDHLVQSTLQKDLDARTVRATLRHLGCHSHRVRELVDDIFCPSSSSSKSRSNSKVHGVVAVEHRAHTTSNLAHHAVLHDTAGHVGGEEGEDVYMELPERRPLLLRLDCAADTAPWATDDGSVDHYSRLIEYTPGDEKREIEDSEARQAKESSKINDAPCHSASPPTSLQEQHASYATSRDDDALPHVNIECADVSSPCSKVNTDEDSAHRDVSPAPPPPPQLWTPHHRRHNTTRPPCVTRAFIRTADNPVVVSVYRATRMTAQAQPGVGCSAQLYMRSARERQHTAQAEPQVCSTAMLPRVRGPSPLRYGTTLPRSRQTDRVGLTRYYLRGWTRQEQARDVGARDAIWHARCRLLASEGTL